jgi:hypothetical protein
MEEDATGLEVGAGPCVDVGACQEYPRLEQQEPILFCVRGKNDLSACGDKARMPTTRQGARRKYRASGLY